MKALFLLIWLVICFATIYSSFYLKNTSSILINLLCEPFCLIFHFRKGPIMTIWICYLSYHIMCGNRFSRCIWTRCPIITMCTIKTYRSCTTTGDSAMNVKCVDVNFLVTNFNIATPCICNVGPSSIAFHDYLINVHSFQFFSSALFLLFFI